MELTVKELLSRLSHVPDDAKLYMYSREAKVIVVAEWHSTNFDHRSKQLFESPGFLALGGHCE